MIRRAEIEVQAELARRADQKRRVQKLQEKEWRAKEKKRRSREAFRAKLLETGNGPKNQEHSAENGNDSSSGFPVTAEQDSNPGTSAVATKR